MKLLVFEERDGEMDQRWLEYLVPRVRMAPVDLQGIPFAEIRLKALIHLHEDVSLSFLYHRDAILVISYVIRFTEFKDIPECDNIEESLHRSRIQTVGLVDVRWQNLFQGMIVARNILTVRFGLVVEVIYRHCQQATEQDLHFRVVGIRRSKEQDASVNVGPASVSNSGTTVHMAAECD
jgi:hypothetical protein